MKTRDSQEQLNEVLRLRQVLTEDPNNIQALSGLAAMMGTAQEPDLQRILSLEPAHEQGSAMLLELDRAHIQTGYSQVQVPPAVSTPTPLVKAPPLEKPVVSRYSIFPKLLVYPLLAFSIYFMFEAFGDWAAFGFFTGTFLLFLLPSWFISAAVRVDHLGIRFSRLFGVYRRDVKWSEMERIEPAAMGVGMRLIVRQGKPLTISSQMSKYPAIVEAVRSVRPDLLEPPIASPLDGAGFSPTGKTFQKQGAAKYGLLLWSIAFAVMFLATLSTAQILPAFALAILLWAIWGRALNTVHTVHLQGNRLSARSFRRQHEASAQHIQDIRIVTRYNRKGLATHFIQLILPDASKIELTGFPEGNEIMYGFLKNWWAAHQTA